MTARSRADAGRHYAAALLRFRRLMRVFTGQRPGSPVGSALQLTAADQNRCSCHTGTIWDVPWAADEAAGGLNAGLHPWFWPVLTGARGTVVPPRAGPPVPSALKLGTLGNLLQP